MSIGMQEQGQAERDKFENELRQIIQKSDESNLLMRVIGSLAFQMHCPQFGYLQQAMGRAYTDIDFAAYGKQAKQIGALLTSMGYIENREVYIATEGERAIFDKPGAGLHVDIFYEKLDFCHTIYWKDRLEIDSPTIPLAELLLEKMQIVKINEKDVIDTIMLFLEHPIGDVDNETINVKLIAKLCANDWGLWRTTAMNLDKVRVLAQGYSQLSDGQKTRISDQVNSILKRLEEEPKPLTWKMRNQVGDRVKWYRDVDEV